MEMSIRINLTGITQKGDVIFLAQENTSLFIMGRDP